jgi:hypothetical protein
MYVFLLAYFWYHGGCNSGIPKSDTKHTLTMFGFTLSFDQKLQNSFFAKIKDV